LSAVGRALAASPQGKRPADKRRFEDGDVAALGPVDGSPAGAAHTERGTQKNGDTGSGLGVYDGPDTRVGRGFGGLCLDLLLLRLLGVLGMLAQVVLFLLVGDGAVLVGVLLVGDLEGGTARASALGGASRGGRPLRAFPAPCRGILGVLRRDFLDAFLEIGLRDGTVLVGIACGEERSGVGFFAVGAGGCVLERLFEVRLRDGSVLVGVGFLEDTFAELCGIGRLDGRG